jgi:hypothetical protein
MAELVIQPGTWHDFQNWVFKIAGQQIQGFGADSEDDEGFMFSYRKSQIDLQIDLNGAPHFNKINDYSAECTIKLHEKSPANTILEGLWLAQQATSPSEAIPLNALLGVNVQNKFTQSGMIGNWCAIEKLADFSRGAKGKVREWKVLIGDLKPLIGVAQ